MSEKEIKGGGIKKIVELKIGPEKGKKIKSEKIKSEKIGKI